MNDVGDDALFAVLGAHEFFQVGPAFAQYGAFVVVEAARFLVEPGVDLGL